MLTRTLLLEAAEAAGFLVNVIVLRRSGLPDNWPTPPEQRGHGNAAQSRCHSRLTRRIRAAAGNYSTVELQSCYPD